MSWNKSVFTTVGTDMMSEVLSGATMTITKAVGGSGTTELAQWISRECSGFHAVWCN